MHETLGEVGSFGKWRICKTAYGNTCLTPGRQRTGEIEDEP